MSSMMERRVDAGVVEAGIAEQGTQMAALRIIGPLMREAMSTVRLPSRRSSPAGLPVCSGSPKTPRTSSRSWKASPRGSPYPE